MPSFSSLPVDQLSQLCPPESGPTGCADGSPFSFLVRRGSTGNERKVVVDFMGGGACWDEACLSADSIRYQAVPAYAALLGGLSTAAANTAARTLGLNVFALGDAVTGAKTFTYIFVPYCTQDIHLGTCTVNYTAASGATRTVRHNGARNTRAVMDWVYAR